MMRLRKVTLLALIGICYLFALRVIGTFFSTVFTSPSITKIAGTISLLAGLAIMVFFVYFYKNYVGREQIKLRIATILVILASLAGLLTQIWDLSIMFNVNASRYQVMIHHYLEAMVPLVSAIFMLIFFLIFYKEISSKELTKLKKATFLAIIAASAGTSLRVFVLGNYFYYLQFGRPADPVSNRIIVLLISIPIILFWLLGLLIFFISFYKVQK